MEVRVNVGDTGENMPFSPIMFQGINGGPSAGHIKGVVTLMQMDKATVVHGHGLGGSLFIFRGDFRHHGNEIKGGGGFHVIPDPVVTLGGGGGVVEGHTRGNHVHDGKAFMTYGRLNQGNQLFLISGKSPGHKPCPQLYGHLAQINGFKGIGPPLLGSGSPVCRG